MKQVTTNSDISRIAKNGYFLGVEYRMITTPEFTRLNARIVPTDMASDKLSKLMKKAKIEVNIPVINVPINGILVFLVVHLKTGKSNPYKKGGKKMIPSIIISYNS